MTSNLNTHNSFTFEFQKKQLCITKWFTISMDVCEYHQRLQFCLDKSKTVLFDLFISGRTVTNSSETSIG